MEHIYIYMYMYIHTENFFNVKKKIKAVITIKPI